MYKIKYQNRDQSLKLRARSSAATNGSFIFSNFSSFSVKWKGKLWQTSEHAYQAAHFLKTVLKLAKKIAQARSAHEAYVLANKNADKAPRLAF